MSISVVKYQRQLFFTSTTTNRSMTGNCQRCTSRHFCTEPGTSLHFSDQQFAHSKGIGGESTHRLKRSWNKHLNTSPSLCRERRIQSTKRTVCQTTATTLLRSILDAKVDRLTNTSRYHLAVKVDPLTKTSNRNLNLPEKK